MTQTNGGTFMGCLMASCGDLGISHLFHIAPCEESPSMLACLSWFSYLMANDKVQFALWQHRR